MLPGVITPAPLAKTPVRLVVPPAETAVGFAVKLVMEGAAEDTAVADGFTQPVNPARLKLRGIAQRA
jgi:hypothetical protein